MANRIASLMGSALVFITALWPPAVLGQPSEPELGERIFVEGTNRFRAIDGPRDAAKGLQLLLESASLKYHLAPFGLCVALSAEPEITNLVEAYAWCQVAARKPNKYAAQADSRAKEVLGKLLVHEGMEAVSAAKRREKEYESK
ncbi:hypothetical protein [Noviherbaspirillum sedimenti]|uniref:Sel1 repeat family protein n=1 Tax=Noviherbaspirillum sedimenti TaxID=2320865 RepID=A0A3A3FX39_9BURK|nr:hypothetical protein [Noviherbaspirillum sedimenti]RJG00284.1 hypothetical protein D3878_00755 [Noviherbaspirillum sedimenti]